MDTIVPDLLVGFAAAFVELGAAIIECLLFSNSKSFVRRDAAVEAFLVCLKDSGGRFVDYAEARVTTFLHGAHDPIPMLIELAVACGIFLFVITARRWTQGVRGLAVILVGVLWVVPMFVFVGDVCCRPFFYR
jgi:hypothetical protein